MKFILAIVFSLFLGVNSQPAGASQNRIAQGRIIGGSQTLANQYPFVVRIQGRLNLFHERLCGATLISENYVVTSADCVEDIEDLILHFGDRDLRIIERTETTMRIPLTNIQTHSQYNSQTYDYNIALIQLPERAPLSSYVRPICVTSATTAFMQWAGTALGWGYTKNGPSGQIIATTPAAQISPILKKVTLPFLWGQTCGFGNMFNLDTMLCAGNTVGSQAAICSGDGGGPLVIGSGSYALAGITSHVSAKGCVAFGYGNVFTRVSTFIPWLRENMEDSLCVV